jgi:hypothetical protein
MADGSLSNDACTVGQMVNFVSDHGFSGIFNEDVNANNKNIYNLANATLNN